LVATRHVQAAVATTKPSFHRVFESLRRLTRQCNRSTHRLTRK
jgi:hypothetical protein